MKQLLEQIKSAVMDEYKRAGEKFGAFNNSPHESYAVILEEYEEARSSSVDFGVSLVKYWEDVKCNNVQANSRLLGMKQYAEQAAAEWVQVAAMCHKATVSKEG